MSDPGGPPRPDDDRTISPGEEPTLANDDRTIPTGEPSTIRPDGQRARFTGPERIAHYRIRRELGAGGMGTVFESYDERMKRRVAVKVLSRHHTLSAKADRRFEQEAWIAGKLRHPNIVRVFDRGDWEELSYYSMELVEGGSLHDVIEHMKHRGRDDELGLAFGSQAYVRWAIEQVVSVARGLDYGHREGIVHRDVKPLNLLVDREHGTIKITDFGLAMDSDATRLTAEGEVMGTLFYMAPEQILARQDEICAATDVYALGVTLFELLTLHLPYATDSPQLYMSAVLTGEARHVGKLNQRVGHDLEVVIGKALEKRPQDRYATAAEFADDLENVLHLRPIRARPAGLATRSMKWVRRKPVHAALIATLALGLPVLGGLGVGTLRSQRLAREARVADLWGKVRFLGQQRRDRELIPLADALLELDPDHDRARCLRALSHLGLSVGDGAADDVELHRRMARADFRRLIDAHRDEAWPYRLEAYAMETWGYVEEARELQALADARRSDDADPLGLRFRAWQAIDRGDAEGAAGLLSKVIDLTPASAEAYNDRARAYEQLGRRSEAIADYRVAVGLAPDQPYARIDLARLLMEEAKLDEAGPLLVRARELQPTNPIVHEALAHYHLERGRLVVTEDPSRALGLFGRAERAARLSLDLNPDGLFAALNLGASLVEQARAGGDKAPLEEALERYRAVVSRWGGALRGQAFEIHAAALVNLCDVLIEMHRPEDALPHCTRVTELRPNWDIGFYNLAGAEALLGRVDEAFRALERDVELGDVDWAYLSQDPWFESLRDDPRFGTLVERMKRPAVEAD